MEAAEVDQLFKDAEKQLGEYNTVLDAVVEDIEDLLLRHDELCTTVNAMTQMASQPTQNMLTLCAVAVIRLARKPEHAPPACRRS